MKVFISYAAADRNLAKCVADGLKTAGFQVWDESQLFPGDNWGEKLGQALQDADAMVVLLTSHSLDSPNIGYDLSYALGKEDYKDRVIPVLAAPPDQPQLDKIPWILKRFKTVNLAEDGAEEGMKRIAQALHGAA